jgi:hypothetical protein
VKVVLTIATVAALVGVALGQQPKSQTKAPLRVSQYMRNAGLLYLDNIDKMFTQAVDDHIALMGGESLPHNPGGMPDDNIYGKALKDLEDHIEVNITSDGDKKFLKLLTGTKNLAVITFLEILRTSDPKYKAMPQNAETSKLYPDCLGQARVIIKSGIFSPGACSDAKWFAASKIDKANQSASAH